MANDRLNIIINVQELTYNPGSSLVYNSKYGLFDKSIDEKTQVLNDFSRYIAKVMKNMLKKRIDYQYRFLHWEPLSIGYIKFKETHGLSGDIWRATGKLYESIRYRTKGQNIIVGIDPDEKYPNGTSVLFVARCLEYGTRYIPARPLFVPTVDYIKRHIRFYWEDFLATHKL